MTETPQTYENIHGRRSGRGVRPYLLILKLFAIAVCVGTLTAVLALVFLHGRPTDNRLWEFELLIVGRAYRLLVIPSIIATLVIGTLLLSTAPKVFWRMRWVQAKLVLIVVFLPTLHVLMRRWMHQLSELVPPERVNEVAAEAMTLRAKLVGGTAAALSVAVLLIILGRIKPHLGQDYGQTFAQGRSPKPPLDPSEPER